MRFMIPKNRIPSPGAVWRIWFSPLRLARVIGGLFGAHEHGGDFFEGDDGVEEFLSGDGGKMDGLFANLLHLARDLFTRGEAKLDLLASLPVEDGLDGVGSLEIDFALGKTGGEKCRESESDEEVFMGAGVCPRRGGLNSRSGRKKRNPTAGTYCSPTTGLRLVGAAGRPQLC